MKMIINAINIYNIHDITYNINGDNFKSSNGKMVDTDLSEFTTPIGVNDKANHPLIAQLEARILASEQEKQELLEKVIKPSFYSIRILAQIYPNCCLNPLWWLSMP